MEIENGDYTVLCAIEDHENILDVFLKGFDGSEYPFVIENIEGVELKQKPLTLTAALFDSLNSLSKQ